MFVTSRGVDGTYPASKYGLNSNVSMDNGMTLERDVWRRGGCDCFWGSVVFVFSLKFDMALAFRVIFSSVYIYYIKTG